MLARCARCQGTFTTERYGRQTCPHCGSELLLADPNQPAPPAPPAAGEAGLPPLEPPAPTGALPPPPPPGGGWSPPPPPPPPGREPELPSPFAERSRRGFFKGFFETWKLVATEPQKFFARVRTDQVGTAILFGLLAAWVGGLVGGLLGLVSNRAQLAQARQSIEQLPPEMTWLGDLLGKYLDAIASGGMVAAQAILVPITTLLGMFVIAGVVHLFLLMFKGAARGFSATLTVVAFSYGVELLAAVPGCGAFVALVWQLIVLVIGLAAVHRTETWKSAVAVFAPVILCCCCGSVGFGSMIAAFASRAANGGGGGITDL